jgi:hypothetical protein
VADAKPRIGDQLRRANVANIVKKLNAGKTLSKTEQAALEEHERATAGNIARRLRKTELAKELGISRVTLDEYLNRPDAPQADDAGAFSVEDTASYIAVNGVKAVNSTEMRRLKEARERIRVEREELELAELRGRLVDKATIEPQIAAVCTLLVTTLQQIFEGELPPKYPGKTVVECREMNAAAIDRVMRQLKAAYAPLTR